MDITSCGRMLNRYHFERQRFHCTLKLLLAVGLISCVAGASKRDPQKDDLARYIAQVQADLQPASSTPGTCWVDGGRLASLSTDYKAALVGDLITIVVSQGLTSTNAGNVSTGRTYSASSGITSLPGQVSVADVSNLLGLQSAETLAGKGQAIELTIPVPFTSMAQLFRTPTRGVLILSRAQRFCGGTTSVGNVNVSTGAWRA